MRISRISSETVEKCIRNYGGKKKQIKQIRNEGLSMVAKFPDTRRHRDRGREPKADKSGR